MPGSGNARGGIQALDAALSLLRAITTFPGPVGLTDLARAAGMPPNKAHRYLASFIHAGLVTQRERSGQYDLSTAASHIGLAALARADFVNRAADELEELSASTGLTALLAVWGSHGATVVKWERTTSFTVTSLGLGSTLPLLSSASGRVFLAFLPGRITAARLQLEVERALETGTRWPDLDSTPESIDRLVERIRADRAARVDGRFIPGLKAISCPITNWQGDAEVAVTLIGLTDDILAGNSPAQRQLADFTARFSIPRPGR